jgi:hypothetical protein
MQPMILKDVVYFAGYLALGMLFFLLLANLLIIVVEMGGNHALANKMIKSLLPFANLFRVASRNRPANETSAVEK